VGQETGARPGPVQSTGSNKKALNSQQNDQISIGYQEGQEQRASSKQNDDEGNDGGFVWFLAGAAVAIAGIIMAFSFIKYNRRLQ